MALFAASACGDRVEREQTLEEGLELQRELNTTDLSLQLSASASSVAAGDSLIYAFSVGNKTRLVDAVRVVITLPPGVIYNFGDSRCAPIGSTVECDLGASSPSSLLPFALVVSIPAGLSGQTLLCEATVHHHFVPFTDMSEAEGPDPNLQNNTASLSVVVK